MRIQAKAGEIAKIKKPKNALSRNALEALAWKAATGAVRVDVFTPEAVNRWRAQRIAAANSDPQKRPARRFPLAGVIRLARAVFVERQLRRWAR